MAVSLGDCPAQKREHGVDAVFEKPTQGRTRFVSIEAAEGEEQYRRIYEEHKRRDQVSRTCMLIIPCNRNLRIFILTYIR